MKIQKLKVSLVGPSFLSTNNDYKRLSISWLDEKGHHCLESALFKTHGEFVLGKLATIMENFGGMLQGYEVQDPGNP